MDVEFVVLCSVWYFMLMGVLIIFFIFFFYGKVSFGGLLEKYKEEK